MQLCSKLLFFLVSIDCLDKWVIAMAVRIALWICVCTKCDTDCIFNCIWLFRGDFMHKMCAQCQYLTESLCLCLCGMGCGSSAICMSKCHQFHRNWIVLEHFCEEYLWVWASDQRKPLAVFIVHGRPHEPFETTKRPTSLMNLCEIRLNEVAFTSASNKNLIIITFPVLCSFF